MKVSCNVPGGLMLPRIRIGKVRDGGYKLSEGENEVPDAYWDVAKTLPGMVNFLQKGVLSDGGSAPAKAATKEESDGSSVPPGLSGMNATEAIALVEKQEDSSVLQLWLNDESRVTVQRAIEEKLGELDD